MINAIHMHDSLLWHCPDFDNLSAQFFCGKLKQIMNDLLLDFMKAFTVIWVVKLASCCCSVTKSCPALCSAMDCSLPGLPVHHHIPELAQTHAHWVSDAIHPSHPLLPSSPSALNHSQHRGLFQLFTSSDQSIRASALASVLPMNIQGWLPLELTDLISLQSKGLSRVFSNTTV